MIENHGIRGVSRRKTLDAKKKSREVSSRERALFENCLSNVRDDKLKTELSSLIHTIEREGERLSKFRSITQLDYYKKKVQEFLEKTNRGAFKIKATNFVDNHGDYNSHIIVEKVDKALDELTAMVMNKEAQVFQIMEQLDLVKGLLTDLYQ